MTRNIAGLGSPLQVLLIMALILLGCVLALNVNGYFVFVLTNVALFALVGIGLNVLMGLTGQVSLGHVGFYAIGAYTMALLTTKLGLSFWLAWPAAALLAAACGALLALPAVRVKGPYLAMVTIAFGFVVENSIVELRSLTGGQNGIMGIAAPTLGSFAQGERAVAVIAVLAVGAALAGFVWLSSGTWGAAMRAVRDSETAAESVGLNPVLIKTTAFAVSALCAGAAGALFAPLSGMITPHTFGFGQSILFVLVLMLGGTGRAMGPIAGAMVVGLLPELLSSLEEYRLLFFGALLLVVLWVAPTGIVGFWQNLQQRWRPKAPLSGTSPVTDATGLPERARQPMSAHGLSKKFGGVNAVSDLSFTAATASVTSLIGPNGAGKSTALNMLSGFYTPTLGSFTLGGRTLAGQSAMQIARYGVARTYQTSLLFNTLSVADNVLLAMCRGKLGGLLSSAHLRSADATKRAHALLGYCGYQGRFDEPAANLAHVDRRLVEIARALALDPDALLLDEPAAGLSREDKASLATLLRRIADAGITVLLVEHDMTLVMDISNHVVVLDAGQRLALGTPSEVQSNPAVRLAYLGEAMPDDADAGEAHKPGQTANQSALEMLGVNALVAGYGGEPVLHSVDLQVRHGEVIALLGANGAGKSTLMRSLAGLHRPVQGGIHLEGRDITQAGAEDVVAWGMVLVPEGRQVFPELSVLDNIRLGGFLYPDDRDAKVETMLLRFPRLRERLYQRAGLLSGGEQQMLAIARALMSRPRILLLDEPSLGLAPKVIAELFASMVEMRRSGMTLLLVDQMAGLALALADRAYVMEGGRIVAQGSAADIAADNTLVQAYLGEKQAGEKQGLSQHV
jgi:ABC-type branched-subunit amino acid transport system ATPase component/ABC-type branched-subunit amino acid transport system permease subunit